MVVTIIIWWFLLMIRVSVDDCDNDDDDHGDVDHGDVDEYDIDIYKMLIVLLCFISLCSTCCNISYVDGTILLWELWLWLHDY